MQLYFDKSSLKTYLLALFLLLPIIFYPFSSDLSIFVLGGKTLAMGGQIYVDFIDIKSPLIFYLFELIHFLTKSQEMLVRLFDFVWQITTVILINSLIIKVFENRKIALISSIVYCIHYTQSYYAHTMQIETFCTLFLILLINSILFKPNSKLITGIILGIIISFKITLILIFIPVIIYLFTSSPKRTILDNIFFIIQFILIAFGILILCYLPIIFNSVAIKNVISIIDYTKIYAQFPNMDMNYPKYLFDNIANYLFSYFSLAFAIASIIGVSISLRKLNINEKSSRFTYFAILLFVFLLISIIIEKKLFAYHFMRLMFIVEIFTGIGIYYSWKYLTRMILDNLHFKILFTFFVILFLIFSPFLRFAKNYSLTYLYNFNKNEYLQRFSNDAEYEKLKDNLELVNYLNNSIIKGDYVNVCGMYCCNIYLYTDIVKYPSLCQSCFYFSTNAPANFKNMFYYSIKKSDWIILNTRDNNFLVNQHNLSSYESFIKDTNAKQYLNDKFKFVKEIKRFKIYKKK